MIPIFIVYGERTYGRVDRVPGECYVVTMFAHLFFFPVVPLRSYVVIEGTESDGGEFRGKRIPISLKSVLAAYVRIPCGIVAIPSGLFGVLGLMAVADQLKMNLLASVALAAVGVGGLAMLFVGGKVGALVQVAVHGLSAILWYVFKDAIERNAAAVGGAWVLLVSLVIMNVALFVYGLTRFLDYAGSTRTRKLLEQLGVEVPLEDDEPPRGDRSDEWDEEEDRRRR